MSIFYWIAEKFYFIWALTIIALAIHWKISLAMLLCLISVIVMLFKPVFFPNPTDYVNPNQTMSHAASRVGGITPNGGTTPVGEKAEGEAEQNKSASLELPKDQKPQKDISFKEAYVAHLIQEAENELNMVSIRQQCTLVIFIVVGFAIILMYPSELVY